MIILTTMKFINECPIHFTELTEADACLVKVPPGWLKNNEHEICYFISEEALLKTTECCMTRRNGYYFSIKLSSLPAPLLRTLLSSNNEPCDLITDNQTLIQRTENFPWELRRFPSHEHIARSRTNPVVHGFTSSLIFGVVSLLTAVMLQSVLTDDVVEVNRVGLFAFILLATVGGGVADYSLRNANYNSSGLFNEGLKLLRAIPPSGEPHRHVATQQL